jgi:hypothetical protein
MQVAGLQSCVRSFRLIRTSIRTKLISEPSLKTFAKRKQGQDHAPCACQKLLGDDGWAAGDNGSMLMDN